MLTTPRLRLRSTRVSDLEAVLATVTDPAVMHHLGGPRDPQAVREAFADPQPPGGCHLAVADLVTDERYGEVRVDRRAASRPGHVASDGGELELSYVFRASAWGHGYAEEACRALLAHVAAAESDHGQPVLIVTQATNAASVRLARRLGFEPRATFVEFDAEHLLAVAPLARFAD